MLLVGLSVLFISAQNTGKATVFVEQAQNRFLYDFTQEGIYEHEGIIGITKIEVADGRARVLSSPCRDQTCVSHGWLEHNGEWTACLPNQLFIQIRGNSESNNSEVDALTY